MNNSSTFVSIEDELMARILMARKQVEDELNQRYALLIKREDMLSQAHAFRCLFFDHDEEGIRARFFTELTMCYHVFDQSHERYYIALELIRKHNPEWEDSFVRAHEYAVKRNKKAYARCMAEGKRCLPLYKVPRSRIDLLKKEVNNG